MTSQEASSGGQGRLYRDQPRAPGQRRQVNGKTRPPSSSSGAISRITKSTAVTANGILYAPSPRRPALRLPESSVLNTYFDPMKDKHVWTMWRSAVNGRIMDDLRERNLSPPLEQEKYSELYPLGRALVKTPLVRFIRVENGSNALASELMNPEGQKGSELSTQQFVFYGIPRVVLKKTKQTTHLVGDETEEQ